MSTPLHANLQSLKQAYPVRRLVAEFFLSRMHRLSDQTRTEDQVKPFFAAALEVIAQGAKLLDDPGQQAQFRQWCEHLLQHELAGLAARAAQHNRRQWDLANDNLGDGLLEQTRRWPQNEALFQHCATLGVEAIAHHHRLLGLEAHVTEAQQAALLSRLLAARLEALAPVNVVQAMKVLDQYRDWLPVAAQAAASAKIQRMERVVRAGILADAITQWGQPEHWLQKVDLVAAHERDGDDALRELLREAVQARADVALLAQERQQRTGRNHLLSVVLRGKSGRLETLLAENPHLADAWDQAESETKAGLAELMRLNRLNRHPAPSDHAKGMVDLLVGMALRRHPGFERENLAARRWNILPPDWRGRLVEAQNSLSHEQGASSIRRNARQTDAIGRHIKRKLQGYGVMLSA